MSRSCSVAYADGGRTLATANRGGASSTPGLRATIRSARVAQPGETGQPRAPGGLQSGEVVSGFTQVRGGTPRRGARSRSGPAGRGAARRPVRSARVPRVGGPPAGRRVVFRSHQPMRPGRWAYWPRAAGARRHEGVRCPTGRGPGQAGGGALGRAVHVAAPTAQEGCACRGRRIGGLAAVAK